jgi:hypothetical protein
MAIFNSYVSLPEGNFFWGFAMNQMMKLQFCGQHDGKPPDFGLPSFGHMKKLSCSILVTVMRPQVTNHQAFYDSSGWLNQ